MTDDLSKVFIVFNFFNIWAKLNLTKLPNLVILGGLTNLTNLTNLTDLQNRINYLKSSNVKYIVSGDDLHFCNNFEDDYRYFALIEWIRKQPTFLKMKVSRGFVYNFSFARFPKTISDSSTDFHAAFSDDVNYHNSYDGKNGYLVTALPIKNDIVFYKHSCSIGVSDKHSLLSISAGEIKIEDASDYF